MRTPQRLVWSEGMFLSPQHLQSLDRYHEALLEARLGALAPAPWGVAALDVDGAALAAGQLKLQRFAGVFPDGLALAFGDGDPEAPPPRTVAEHFPPTVRALDVYLAIPRERDGVPSAAEDAVAARARYAVVSRPVADAMQPGASAAVAFARPSTSLLLGSEPRDDHEVVKIAELVRGPSGQLAVSDAYLPPLLQLGAAPRLVAALRGLVSRLVAKHRHLGEGRARARPAGTDGGTADLERALELVVLGGAIPAIAQLADAPESSPREAYAELARLAGQLAAFAPDPDVAGLPRFSHSDLRSTFEPLLARLDAFLGGIGLERFTRVPLEVRGNLHVARFADERLLREGQLFLSVKSDIPEVHVAEQLPRLCKIAAASEVQALVQAAAPGLALQPLHRPPPEIPARAGTVIFALAQAERLWKSVLADRSLAIYLPPPFDPSRAKVELLATAPSGTHAST